jgi:hypothetical protein
MERAGIAAAAVLALLIGSAVAQASESKAGEMNPSVYAPGEGFDVAKGEKGSLNLSAYVLLRYLNQLPANQTFTDHLGNTRKIDTRQDIQLHRVMIHFSGFIFSEKFTHDVMVWAVNSTNSVTALAGLNYRFSKAFTLSGGIGALPGTRSMNYEHPYFLGTDRQMADEFFRPSFTGGIWASGEPIPSLRYRVMVGDSMNIVDISAGQLTRDFAYAGTISWFPTTGEFGPKQGFGDFEMHDRLATRFGFSVMTSREDRFSQVDNPYPDNSTVKLSDSVPLFQTGALAPGVTVQQADVSLLAIDGAMKHRGFFLFGEAYFRRLGDFDSGGAPLPQDVIHDTGFMIQASSMVVPQRWEAYAAHSQLYGQFNRAWELTVGANYFPFKDRHLRVNGSLTYVDRSPVSSLFGYFVGGQKGPTIALATDYTF